ncbi:MAG TPA: hypothetical protein DCG57_13815 [Candidatus Riflebacteria bacterium]|nr:hypothetical protein [Candidatus Riflebacteria bacterium]
MELLIIVLVLVYSVWSEVNKAKKDENVDIDFSELSSLDDFFKNTGSQPAQKVSTPSGVSKKPVQQRSKKQPAAKRDAVNYDDLPGLTGQVNRDRQGSGKPARNYDELPQLTGVVNYDRNTNSSENERGDELSEEAKKMFALGQKSAPQHPAQAEPMHISFDRDSVIKAFVMSEVLQRYDIQRIYARIPGINNTIEED